MSDHEHQLVSKQRLKAAVHYTTGAICEENEEDGLTFDRQFIAVLAETAFNHCQTMAVDLEAFAKHAKRSTVNVDDVKLMIRKSPALLEHITEEAETLQKDTTKKRNRK